MPRAVHGSFQSRRSRAGRVLGLAPLLASVTIPAALTAMDTANTTAAGTNTAADSAYAADLRAWQERRERNLRSDTGWLTVTGLFWLEEGDHTFGTATGSDMLLPAGSGPARAGVFTHRAGTTSVRAASGVTFLIGGKEVQEATLRPDSHGQPDVLELGRLRFLVIERSGRFGIRMRDLESDARKQFQGIDRYAVDPAWRVEAGFEPYTPPRRIAIASVIGTVDSSLCPGALVFSRDGRTLRLEPILEDPDATSLFVIFSDATSGDETYPAGRFLYCDLPRDGKTMLDFNRAYNPPCAFTPFATCPLPPPQNALPIAVRAGEKTYGEH
jgi:uncharacterized protein (DUF1684 family)